MELKTFFENFADQFEEVNPAELTVDTEFKELEEWTSLIALSVIAMIDEEYDVLLKGADIKSTTTLGELFELVQSKL